MRSTKISETALGRLGRLSAPLVAIGCALVAVACGSSGNPQSGARGGPLLKLAQCMRARGVSSFPDPKSTGGLIIPNNVNTEAPAFKAAQAACNKLLPDGGPRGGAPSAQAKAQMLAISKCMRRHGVTGFPDPTTTQPSDPGIYSVALGRGGIFLAVPNTISTDSPAFKDAAGACHFGAP
jgi:hypothetical protein